MHSTQLVYKNPNMLKLIERFGKVCYRAEGNIKENSASGFVKGIVKRNHESVIEHSNLIYEIKPAKRNSDPYKGMAEAFLNRDLVEVFTINNLIKYKEIYGNKYLCGNVRMFKDLIRGSALYSTSNEIINDIRKSFNYLPGVLFADMYPEGSLETVDSEWKGLLEPLASNEDVSVFNIDKNIFTGNYEGITADIEDMLTCSVVLHTTDRSLTHQIVRARLGGISQESQRFVPYDEMFKYTTPECFTEGEIFDVESELLINGALEYPEMMKLIHAMYRSIRAKGHPAEASRSVLCNAAMSEIALTKTLAQWRHYFGLRIEDKAGHTQLEHKLIANSALIQIHKVTKNLVFPEIQELKLDA